MRLVQLRKRVARTVRRRETTGRREVVGVVLREYEASTGFRVFVGGGQKHHNGGRREEKGRRRVIKVKVVGLKRGIDVKVKRKRGC